VRENDVRHANELEKKREEIVVFFGMLK
jgi:hypothetical protein